MVLSLFFKVINILTFLSCYVSGRNKPEQSVLGYGLQKILKSHGIGEEKEEKVHDNT